MKKLSKKDEAKRGNLVQCLRDAQEYLEAKVEKYDGSDNADILVTAAVEGLNGVIVSAEEFREGIVASMSLYFGDRSEKWQESDAGGEYQAWISEWEEPDEPFETIELDDVFATKTTETPEGETPEGEVPAEPTVKLEYEVPHFDDALDNLPSEV